MKANNEIYIFLVLNVEAAGFFFFGLFVCFLLCFVLLQPNLIERTKID